MSIVCLVWLSLGLAQRGGPPRGLIPKNVLVHVTLERPRELISIGSPQVADISTWLAQIVGLPRLDGLDLERPWFGFAVTSEGAPGPWFLLPVADRAAFDASVIGMPDGFGVSVEEAHVLIGARPFPEGGGGLPDRSGDALIELQTQPGPIYSLFSEELKGNAVLGELDAERERAQRINPQYQPPFAWNEVQERVSRKYQTLFELLEQSELMTLEINPSSETVRFRLEVGFDSDSRVGRLIARQKPTRPSGLEAFSEQSAARVWADLRLGTGAELVEPAIENVANALGLSSEHLKRLSSADAETLSGFSARPGRVVTETIYRPKSRSIEEFRQLARELHARSPSSNPAGIRRIYESEVSRIGSLPVDRLVEYIGVGPLNAGRPTSESYFAWGDDKLFSTAFVGDDTGDAFHHLTKLVSRAPGGTPDQLSVRLAEAPRDLVFLFWFDVEAWDRAQIGEVLPPMTRDALGPAAFVHGTTDGPVLRFGGTFDLAQFRVMAVRKQEIIQAATEFSEKGHASLYGDGVPKNPADARVWYQKAAALGDAEAKFSLGYLYASGLGVEQDYDEALVWYGKAAALGNDKAMSRAGNIFYYGHGREVDHTTAATLYQDAARLGNPLAQRSLASMFETGRGVEQDLAKAAELYSTAAEQGHARAQRDLGRLYFYGRGVAKDLEQSEKWYRAAAENGDAAAMREVGQFLSVHRPPETREPSEAVQWYQRASDSGDMGGTLNLAHAYNFGQGVEKDDARAVELYQRVIADGAKTYRRQASYWLSGFYGRGRHVETDFAESISLLQASAEDGFVRAQYSLAHRYYYGQGVERNDNKAVEWLRLSADKHSYSALLFGFAFQQGRGVERSDVDALTWFRKSAEMGNRKAEWVIGEAYERGAGVDQDLGQAAIWYRKSAEGGYPDGQLSLGRLYMMGAGVSQDLTEAYFWLALAAKSGGGARWTEMASKLRESVAERLSPNELEQVHVRIQDFYSTHP